jgi:Tol biopolymer transport system component
MSFSPDGRFILYDGPGAGGPDVHLLSVDGRRDVALAPHPADDFAAGWSSDGQRILFTSNRTGPLSLWTLAVKDGQAQGDPQLALADAGNIEPLGIARNGSLYYWLDTGLVDVYTAAIDPESAVVVESPKPVVHRFVASNQFPDWSPDRRYLLYQSNRPGSDNLIVIRALDTGAERELRPKAPLGFQPPHWNTAGDAILVSGTLAGKNAIYRIDPQSGAVSVSVELPSGKLPFTPAWSRDGKTLFGRFNSFNGIHRMDVATGAIQTLFNPNDPPGPSAGGDTGPSDPLLSPDGHSLLFQQRDRPRTDNLLIMPPEGGTPRVLLSVKWPEQFPAGAYAWTPDSRRIVFVQRSGKQFEILVIPAEGGQSRRTGIHMNGIRFLRLHPDGKRIAFQGGETGGEVWVIENLF